jgi:hypothetical protein
LSRETGRLLGFFAPGRHTRRAGLDGLRRACLAALIMLVVQFGLGMVLNLYVPVPSSDQHAGILREISSAPVTLTAHALLGLALICAAMILLTRAIAVRHPVAIVLAAAGLGAIAGAFAAGEIFVRTATSGASLAMAILTGAALLCYIGSLANAGAARGQAMYTPPQATAAAPARRGLPLWFMASSARTGSAALGTGRGA